MEKNICDSSKFTEFPVTECDSSVRSRIILPIHQKMVVEGCCQSLSRESSVSEFISSSDSSQPASPFTPTKTHSEIYRAAWSEQSADAQIPEIQQCQKNKNIYLDVAALDGDGSVEGAEFIVCNQAVRSIAEPGELLPDTLKRLVSEHQKGRCDSPESNSDSEVAYIKMITNGPLDSALVTYTPGAVVIPEANHMQDDEDDSPRSPEPAAVIFLNA